MCFELSCWTGFAECNGALVVIEKRNWIGVINAKIREKEFEPDHLSSGIL
jgi:hypothetical protein